MVVSVAVGMVADTQEVVSLGAVATAVVQLVVATREVAAITAMAMSAEGVPEAV